MRTVTTIAAPLAATFCVAAALSGAARAEPALPAVDETGRIAPQALADYAGETLAEAAHPGAGTVSIIEDCYATATTPAAMQRCIALDEVSDFADYRLHAHDGSGHHSYFWTTGALASRITDARATFAFGSRAASDAWTQHYLLSAYDTATESSATSGPLSGQVFTFK